MILFENDTVAIRRFSPSDWPDVLEIARTNAASPFAACDSPWPTDEQGVRGMCEYIATDASMYAIVAKDLDRAVCFVNFNGVNDDGYLDIGHVMNLNYAGRDYEYQGLKLLVDHAIAAMDIAGIRAYWALDDRIKLEPLKKLGMKVVATFENDYLNGQDGTFTGCELKISREDYEKGAAHTM